MFIVTREGEASTKKRTRNQCNFEGCAIYRYTIDATTDEKLLPDTYFAIDHNDLDKIARRVIADNTSSCELMAWTIVEQIQLFCSSLSINLLAISVQIRPVDGNAWVTLKRTVFKP